MENVSGTCSGSGFSVTLNDTDGRGPERRLVVRIMNQCATSTWCAPQSPMSPLPYWSRARNPRRFGENGRSGAPSGRPELPHLPVEPGGHGLRVLFRVRVASRLHDVHVPDRTEHAAVEDLLGFHEVIPAALLRAHLHDAIGLLVRIEHRVDARDRVRRGLLHVDVLAGRHRVNHDAARARSPACR